MKKLICLLCTLLCIAGGVIYALTLFTNTDAATGLLKEGSVWLRYLLIGVPAVIVGLASLCMTGSPDRPLPAISSVLGFCGMLFSGIVGIGLFTLDQGSMIALISSILLGMGAIWFAAYLLRGEKAFLLWALAGMAGWIAIIVQMFLVRVSSAQHMVTTVELTCCLGCLVGFLGMVQAGYTPARQGSSHRLFFYGMTAFLFGFCILLPQEIWLFMQKSTPAFLQGKGIAAGALGLAGCFAAFRAVAAQTNVEKQEPASEPDPYLDQLIAALDEPDNAKEEEKMPARPAAITQDIPPVAPQQLFEAAPSVKEETAPAKDPLSVLSPAPTKEASAVEKLYPGRTVKETATAAEAVPVRQPAPVAETPVQKELFSEKKDDAATESAVPEREHPQRSTYKPSGKATTVDDVLKELEAEQDRFVGNTETADGKWIFKS